MGFFRSLFSAVDGIIEISVSDVTTGLEIEWINQPDIDRYTKLPISVSDLIRRTNNKSDKKRTFSSSESRNSILEYLFFNSI
jgi:hypothetical protein